MVSFKLDFNQSMASPRIGHPNKSHGDKNHHFPDKWGFPEMWVPQNGWFIRQDPIKMDDWGVLPFQAMPKPWAVPSGNDSQFAMEKGLIIEA